VRRKTHADPSHWSLRCLFAAVPHSTSTLPEPSPEDHSSKSKIIDAIYESARTGRPVKLAQPLAPTRGPDPQEETF
jgi:hypothetical protein